MSENKLPQRGDMVLYYPPLHSDPEQDSFPAVVLDGNYAFPKLGVFATSYKIKKGVPPKGNAKADAEGYWDWRPEKISKKQSDINNFVNMHKPLI